VVRDAGLHAGMTRTLDKLHAPLSTAI